MPTKPKQKLHLVEQPLPEPAWVTEMHEHFRSTGLYRAEDLQRVLGDPREAVQLSAGAELVPAAAANEPDEQ